MHKQGAPGKTQNQKGGIQKVEAGTGNLGGIQRHSKNAEMQLGKPKPAWN